MRIAKLPPVEEGPQLCASTYTAKRSPSLKATMYSPALFCSRELSLKFALHIAPPLRSALCTSTRHVLLAGESDG